jgi:hypothetical protein
MIRAAKYRFPPCHLIGGHNHPVAPNFAQTVELSHGIKKVSRIMLISQTIAV